MILTILQQQNGARHLQRSGPSLESPPPLEPMSPSERSYTEQLPYADVHCYQEEGGGRDAEENDDTDMQQMFSDTDIPHEVCSTIIHLV